ncbi:UMTA methyltransferase [Colletotrichum graminicola]|nr:UMTA methyltransferase [Colletotrichum graminicola]
MSETITSPATNLPTLPSNTIDTSSALTGGPTSTTTTRVGDKQLPTDASMIDYRILSYSASLISIVIEYPDEYGRRRHACRNGSYQFPDDEREMDRLDFYYSLIAKAIHKIFLAPAEKGKIHRIVNVGTGTGI